MVVICHGFDKTEIKNGCSKDENKIKIPFIYIAASVIKGSYYNNMDWYEISVMYRFEKCMQ